MRGTGDHPGTITPSLWSSLLVDVSNIHVWTFNSKRNVLKM